jgi:hypothetical protein
VDVDTEYNKSKVFFATMSSKDMKKEIDIKKKVSRVIFLVHL